MKNSNLKDPIIFIDKKAELMGKSKFSKLHKGKSEKKAKIIGYQEHKKMKIHEAKRQKLMKSNVYKNKKNISICFIAIISILILMFMWNKFSEPTIKENETISFKVENENLSSSNASTYSSIIKESTQSLLGIKYPVKVENLHKNGNLIFAKGSFNIPGKGDINYDMILKNYKVYSLKVNGEEYAKK